MFYWEKFLCSTGCLELLTLFPPSPWFWRTQGSPLTLRSLPCGSVCVTFSSFPSILWCKLLLWPSSSVKGICWWSVERGEHFLPHPVSFFSLRCFSSHQNTSFPWQVFNVTRPSVSDRGRDSFPVLVFSCYRFLTSHCVPDPHNSLRSVLLQATPLHSPLPLKGADLSAAEGWCWDVG